MRKKKKRKKRERERARRETETETERQRDQAVYSPYHQSFTGEQYAYIMFCINKKILQIFSITQKQQQSHQQKQTNIITNNYVPVPVICVNVALILLPGERAWLSGRVMDL